MNPEHTSGEQRRSEVAELRRELRDKQSYLSDGREELWAEISRWLMESYNTPVGSLRTKVRSRLAELQEDPQHKMYDHPEVDEGTEAFPEDCKGCPHYGVQCPVLARHISKKTLARHFDEAEDDDELQGRLSRFAADNHCKVIQEEIDDWQTGYAQFLQKGERLRMELNADINNIDLDDVRPGIKESLDGEGDGDAAETPTSDTLVPAGGMDGSPPDADVDGDTPPDEVADRVAAVADSLMSDDGEEGEA